MGFKCAVVVCKTGYSSGPRRALFQFPEKDTLRAKWVEFVNRKDFVVTESSRICIDHFESTCLSLGKERARLNYSLNPIPTIHPTSIAKSQLVIPIRVRKSPKLRVFQKDELSLFKDKYTVINKENVVSYMKVADEYRNFHVDISEFGVTAYRVKIDSGIAVVQECVHVTNDLHVVLSFESSPIPLPDYISTAAGCRLTSLDMLTNLPNYCRNASHSYHIEVIEELIKLRFYHLRGRHYPSVVLRFSLLLRYTSNSAYKFINKFIPLPSERLLKKLKSHTIDSSKAFCTLRNKLLIGNDVVILLDEMYLQTQVQFDGKSVIGCDGDLNMFKSILCFMVVSLKKTIPYIIKAIPIVRLTFLDVYNGILNCISILNEGKFHVRGVIADNHSTNVKAYKVLVKNFPLDDREYCIKNPSNSAQHIFLMFDTVHLIKNIRNNLISSRFFQVPQFLFNLQDTVFNIPPQARRKRSGRSGPGPTKSSARTEAVGQAEH